MITYCPLPDFVESAAVMDRRRLRDQRLDTLQVARCLAGVPSSWRRHPTVAMWRGFPRALLRYQEANVARFQQTGNSDKSSGDLSVLRQTRDLLADFEDTGDPPWLGDKKFHRSHQSNLVRMMPDHYRRYFPDVKDNWKFVWPPDVTA